MTRSKCSLLMFAALGLLVGSACDKNRGGSKKDAPPVAEPAATSSGAESKGSTHQELSPSPEEQAPEEFELPVGVRASMERAQGRACVQDRGCPGHLRCIERACTTPPALTGERDERTPQAIFTSAPDSEEPIAEVWLELAVDAPERERGLMYRTEMKDDWGMLFIYPSARPLSFWMKNTYMPLDMVFIDARGEVVGVIQGAEPLTLSPRAVETPARYVLELKAGRADQMGIHKGTWMRLEDPPRDHYRPQR